MAWRDPEERRSPREAGLSKGAAFGDGLHCDDSPLPPPALLRHCAAVLDSVALLLCQSQPISTAGKALLMHVADRLRRLAEVLR